MSRADYERMDPYRQSCARRYGAARIEPARISAFGPALLCALLGLCCSPAWAQTPITLFSNFVGNVNYEATGGSLRSAPNTSNACSLNPSNSATLTGIPAGSAVRAAYLYWAGSGSTPDTTVNFNGSGVTADRVFTDRFPFNGTNYDFFSGFADVTGLIAGNGTFTFSGLSVANGAPYCGVQAVVAGWALIVVYDHPSEDLRAVNVFDGFRLFRASALTLTVDTFRIPPAPINGKVTHVTWEGDPQNSGAQGGISESLTFNGAALDDGLVPPGSNPAVQQFDGTVNALGVTTAYGVDVDTYDVSALLSPGDTSATTTYSSGQDLVLLSAEVISFTTEPIVDLSIVKSHSGNFAVGGTHDYTIRVANNGPEDDVTTIAVADSLPGGLSYAGFAGTGWACTNTGPDVACTHAGPLAAGTALPDLAITVQVGAAAAPSVDNTATVSSASFDGDLSNNSSTDQTTVLASDLGNSTKSVVDLNGADADPGDTLRYTITLRESAGVPALGVRLTDDVPALAASFTVVSAPPGSADNSTGPGSGSNGTGFIDIGNVTVLANGSVAIIFDMVIAATANLGDIVPNQANVSNATGAGATPAAPNVVVSQSQVGSGGTKTLYLYDLSSADPNGFDQGPRPYLSRTPPSGAQSDVTVDANGPPRTWTLTPALQAPLTIDAGSVPVTLYLSKGGTSPVPVLRSLTVEIASSSGSLGSVTQTLLAPPRSTPAAFTFNIPLPAVTPLPAGDQLRLILTNNGPGGGTVRIRVFPTVGANVSRIDLDALTVINVDAAASYDAPYPGGAARNLFTAPATMALRADVSDPFGVFDIASVVIDLDDPSGTPVLVAQSLTQVQTLSGAQATYEYVLPIAVGTAQGVWTYRITAIEGSEGLVTHTRSGSFQVGGPALTVTKSVAALTDAFNGASNPKAIPGAVMIYTINVANSSAGSVDADSLEIRDALPAEAALYVDTSGGDPIAFMDGSTTSGLVFNYAGDVSFSNRAGGCDERHDRRRHTELRVALPPTYRLAGRGVHPI